MYKLWCLFFQKITFARPYSICTWRKKNIQLFNLLSWICEKGILENTYCECAWEEYQVLYIVECRGVVLLWAGGPRPPQYLALTKVKVGLGPPIFSSEKGPKWILKLGPLQSWKRDYAPVQPITGAHASVTNLGPYRMITMIHDKKELCKCTVLDFRKEFYSLFFKFSRHRKNTLEYYNENTIW